MQSICFTTATSESTFWSVDVLKQNKVWRDKEANSHRVWSFETTVLEVWEEWESKKLLLLGLPVFKLHYNKTYNVLQWTVVLRTEKSRRNGERSSNEAEFQSRKRGSKLTDFGSVDALVAAAIGAIGEFLSTLRRISSMLAMALWQCLSYGLQ